MIVKNKSSKILNLLPINISGEWIENQKYKWKGSAISSEPIVAVVFLKHDNIIEWCKSSGEPSDFAAIKLWLSRYNKIDLQAQVGLSVGDGDTRSTSFLKSASYKPNIKIDTSGKTGEIIKFTEVEGFPKISFEILFIAQSDIKFGRNRIWHLRENINNPLPDKVKEILKKGRTGHLIC